MCDYISTDRTEKYDSSNKQKSHVNLRAVAVICTGTSSSVSEGVTIIGRDKVKLKTPSCGH